MAKLVLTVILGGALANGLLAPAKEPPLLIDSAPAPTAPLDAANH